jgi:hypothetical protein
VGVLDRELATMSEKKKVSWETKPPSEWAKEDTLAYLAQRPCLFVGGDEFEDGTCLCYGNPALTEEDAEAPPQVTKPAARSAKRKKR